MTSAPDDEAKRDDSLGDFLTLEDAAFADENIPLNVLSMATENESVPPLPKQRRHALIWFRKDLRLHDNLALQAALHDPEMLIFPIYIIHKPVNKRCGPVRFQFLLECIEDLSSAIAKKGSELLVLRGEAIEVLKVIIPAWGITDLFYEGCVMPYAVARDREVKRMAEDLNVRVTETAGRTLYHPQDVLQKTNGAAITDFSRFLSLVQELPQPPMPIAAPSKIPALPLSKQQLATLIGARRRVDRGPNTSIIFGDLANPFTVPKLGEFGLATPEQHSFLYGGETAALARLDAFCADEARVGRFEKPKTSPACIERPSTTALSAHIGYGCLSVREFFYRIMFIQLRFPGQQGPPTVTLDGQLLWREFFYCFAVAVPGFDTQKSNPFCRQINWRLPEPGAESTKLDDDAKHAKEQFQAWTEGRTGFPWIDAVMRQIEQEGWAHHLGRHAVACFLTRGDLYISWLQGAHFFQEKLIDMDWAINIGNWLWVSSSCFFNDYKLIHSPSLFVQKWDPRGEYIKKYVPALRKMPVKYIFEPWKAPLSVQRAANCLIGKDYPFPIVDHKSAVKRCIQWLDEVHGNTSSPASSLRTSSCGSLHAEDGQDAPCPERKRARVSPTPVSN
ncbi:hypothetical protein Poli38472_003427 [Pythium oligandrum]|uniref:Photolyase/cryptochrome alpha/beta domain-containing protein n=1 Tax=Pythium oligandrum TaxID=41045 RepID=A0A8K1C6L5_PYTOL|nr:hypothetical protein Poli38472_003427 [Pythium oligandrum]|eukprot:TMW57502.1 hypothetical protein Poli38472_003427 [Pythium oligandrum]